MCEIRLLEKYNCLLDCYLVKYFVYDCNALAFIYQAAAIAPSLSFTEHNSVVISHVHLIF